MIQDQSEQEPEKCNGVNTEECKPSLKDGTLRLVGGRDETEVCEPSLKDGTLQLVGGRDETEVCEPSLRMGLFVLSGAGTKQRYVIRL